MFINNKNDSTSQDVTAKQRGCQWKVMSDGEDKGVVESI